MSEVCKVQSFSVAAAASFASARTNGAPGNWDWHQVGAGMAGMVGMLLAIL